jgi:hypothetical protein
VAKADKNGAFLMRGDQGHTSTAITSTGAVA